MKMAGRCYEWIRLDVGGKRRRTGEIEGNGPRRSQQPILHLFPWTLRNVRASPSVSSV